MNKLEDAPELKAAFEKAFQDFPFLCVPKSHRITCQHFFIAGYEAAIAERAKFDEQNGLIIKDLCNTHEVKPQPEKPQRKIVQLIKTDQGWFSLANTGEWFYLVRPLDSECHWVKYPDLPQD